MKRIIVTILLLMFASSAYAFRCGHRLVKIGDHKSDVIQKCGEPDSVQERRAIRGSRLRHPNGILEIDQFQEVLIEEWTYNFGPRKFQQFLQFEDGALKKVEDLGYGY